VKDDLGGWTRAPYKPGGKKEIQQLRSMGKKKVGQTGQLEERNKRKGICAVPTGKVVLRDGDPAQEERGEKTAKMRSGERNNVQEKC